ncbi:dipeptide ABC transporter ATP-binding protein [Actinomadura algeriensis]|uniref:Peptide/nickel transport system ATP-binding protein n=1 Tax=Actinomadura algeriensis TaxID=1679523 RepID=A0ABR9JWK8_9ACTN|nr:ABC transporter ATP-binding protein [Actinomadura algeriensis]MBE1534954.1 peptide/nickel transport system ATP-binding protein [Actinomadura algeriensis]
MTVLEVADLRVRYAPDVRAVRGAGFAVGAGETLGVVGASGSGKTALALAVLGLLPDGARAAGSVRLHGEELLGRSDAALSRIRGKDLAMVFQDLSALDPHQRIGDQIAEAVRVHRRTGRAAARAQAVELLERVGVHRRARAYPHELSGGTRRRVLIAMAMANDPSVLIADEPTAGLDVTVQAQILDVLRTLRASGTAIVLIAHDLGVVAGIADRVMVMHAGRTVEEGPVEEVYRRPRDPGTIALLRSAPRIDRIPPAPRARPSGPAVLEVSGLARHHGAVRAVDGVTFDVRPAETLALVGESGCGKTTALLEILRLATPRRGRLTVFGEDTAALRRARRKELRRDVQPVFQDPLASLNPRMRVRAIIAEPLTAHGLPAEERVRELLDLVELEPAHADRYPHQLSGGQRQRVGIARALALEPRLLLLDEPVASLDAHVQANMLNLLQELQSRLGLAYVFVAHDLAVVHQIADRVAVMHMGRVVELGPTSAVYRTPAHPYTRALLAAVPIPDPVLERARPRVVLHGDVPDPSDPPDGCRFRPRCPIYPTLAPARRTPCDASDPQPRTTGRPDHQVACHHPLDPLQGARP